MIQNVSGPLLKSGFLFLCCTAFFCTKMQAQQLLSLKEVPALVEKNVPQLQAARASAAASQSVIDYEKRGIMPDLSVGYQAGMATYNNITGMSYPGLMMPISGPPTANNQLNFVPGTAAAALITWRPVTFGQRNAAIEKASAQYHMANAGYNEQFFRYQYMALQAYLDAAYFAKIIAAHKANITRYQNSLEQSLILAKNGLKPGIDTLQIQSSIAQAEIDLLQSQTLYKQKLIELGTLIGHHDQQSALVLKDTSFTNPVVFADTTMNTTAHPLYQAAAAQKEVTAAQLNEVNKSWRPKLDIWGNAYSRGSGVDATGTIHRVDGFNFTRTNLGAGVQISFPILQFYQLGARKKQYEQLLNADEARVKQVQLDLNKQVAIALEQYQTNIIVLQKTAFRLQTALDAFNSLKLSYETGLVDFTRLAQAQFELQQASINHAGALLLLQRSLLDVSVAKGDLNLFLNQ
ncbi:TolC family protein [Niabella hirudinis]|uniref:TolC family protein n=1 Tax=Niabella hirudinis TaxID=1285929 RepID=UPI003EBD86B5